MDTSTHNTPATDTGKPQIATEFGSWPMEQKQFDAAQTVREEFHNLLGTITMKITPGNERYLAIVKTKLEEACFFAVKGIAKPTN